MPSTSSCSSPNSRYPPSKPYVSNRPRSPHPEDSDHPQTPCSPFQVPFSSPRSKSFGSGSKPSTPTGRTAPERMSSLTKEGKNKEERNDTYRKESSVKHSKSSSKPVLRAPPARTAQRHRAPMVISQTASLSEVPSASVDRADSHDSVEAFRPKSILKSGSNQDDEPTSAIRKWIVAEIGHARQTLTNGGKGKKKVTFDDRVEVFEFSSFPARIDDGLPQDYSTDDEFTDEDEAKATPTDVDSIDCVYENNLAAQMRACKLDAEGYPSSSSKGLSSPKSSGSYREPTKRRSSRSQDREHDNTERFRASGDSSSARRF